MAIGAAVARFHETIQARLAGIIAKIFTIAEMKNN